MKLIYYVPTGQLSISYLSRARLVRAKKESQVTPHHLLHVSNRITLNQNIVPEFNKYA